MPSETVYSVTDGRGATHSVTSAERAERLSRAGYVVTATTRRRHAWCEEIAELSIDTPE